MGVCMYVYYCFLNFMSLFYVYVFVLYELLSLNDNVVRTAFLCKHERLSRVFYNKITEFPLLLLLSD